MEGLTPEGVSYRRLGSDWLRGGDFLVGFGGLRLELVDEGRRPLWKAAAGWDEIGCVR